MDELDRECPMDKAKASWKMLDSCWICMEKAGRGLESDCR